MPPTSSFFADVRVGERRTGRTPDEARLRRGIRAEPRDSVDDAPIELGWDDRRCSVVAPGRFVISVPYVGGPPQSGVDAGLTAELLGRWCARPAGLWTVSAVVAVFDRVAGRAGFLNLAVSAAPNTAGAGPLDGSAMARELRAALELR